MKNNAETYQQFKALVGNEHNITASSKVTNYVNEMLNPKTGAKVLPGKALHVINTINSVAENLNRYAEFDRTLRKGGSVQEAMYNAGEITVNFSRGGKSAKLLDRRGVPYLNAGLQGIDRTVRSFANNRINFISKSLQVSAVPATALYLLNRNDVKKYFHVCKIQKT